MSLGAHGEAVQREVRNLFALARERYRVKLKREAGEAPPWTDDPLLANYHVCNVFRDDDAVSRYMMRDLLPRLHAAHPDMWCVPLVAAVVGRLVNNERAIAGLYHGPEHSHRLCLGTGLCHDWDEALHAITVNTQAYRVNTPLGLNNRKGYEQIIHQALGHSWFYPASLQEAFEQFVRVGLSPFIAYQAAHDLKGNVLPAEPIDGYSWTFIGPGALRGALRLNGHDLAKWVAESGRAKVADHRPGAVKDSWIRGALRDLAGVPYSNAQAWGSMWARVLLGHSANPELWPSEWPPWALGEAEHMLCEYDKIERWRQLGPGPARRFNAKERTNARD